MTLLADGQRVAGAYRVDRFLGEGDFAEVYRVRHEIVGRQAMKVFKRGVAPDEPDVAGVAYDPDTERGLGEAIMLSAIGHPSIVRMFHTGTTDTAHGRHGFITMEYVGGGDLWRFWRGYDGPRIPTAEVARILRQLADGLAVAHSANPPIVHRDICPRNILISHEPDGVLAKLSDFGLATTLRSPTLLHRAPATLAYMAPEALSALRPDSRASDVWSLGAVAYLLLTDTLPYESDTPGARRKPPRPPRDHNPDIDAELERVVLRALEPDPRERFPDATALAAALDRRDGREVVAPVTNPRPGRATDGEGADQLLALARELGAQAVTVDEAARLLERALAADPSLRQCHGRRLRLWRKGVLT